MCEDVLKVIFKSVIVAKILCASLAWWGFATISDKQHFESFVRRAIRLGFYAGGGPAVADLVANLDKTLFASVLANNSRVLHKLLPDRNDCSYSLRPRCHACALPVRRDNRNYFDRHLFKDM